MLKGKKIKNSVNVLKVTKQTKWRVKVLKKIKRNKTKNEKRMILRILK